MTTNLLRLLPRSDHPALIDPDGRQMTFNELWSDVEGVAADLHERGIRSGDRVVLLIPMSIELYVVLLALFHRGATVTLVDPSADIQTLLTLHPPDAFIGIPKAHALRVTVPALRGLKVYLSTGFTPLPHRRIRRRNTPPPPIEPPSAPALLTFTSGTTSTPKAIARSHAFLVAQHRVLGSHMRFGPGDVDMPTLPVFLLHSLASGATCVVANANLATVGSIDPIPVLNQIETLGVTSISGSPAFFQCLTNHLIATGECAHSVRTVFTGGARVPAALVQALSACMPSAAIEIVYGSTECEPIAVLDALANLDRLSQTTHLGALVGRPVDDVSVRIDGSPNGEILVAGPHVNEGYVDNPEADAAHKIREGDRVWHRTGDAGHLDDEGNLWLVGRVGESINGHWPLVVEGLAEELDFVVRAALVGVDGHPTLAVETRSPPADWAQRIRAHTGLSPIAVNRIPVDTRHNAKVDRNQLAATLKSNPSGSDDPA